MLVPATDADYVAWLEGGAQPSNAATMADLEATLAIRSPRNAAHLCRRPALSQGEWRRDHHQPQPVPFLTDPVSRNTIASAYDYAVAKGHHHRPLEAGGRRHLHQAGRAAAGDAVQKMATFVQSCFSCESTLSAGITDGSITTLAQIDAAFAAISNVFP